MGLIVLTGVLTGGAALWQAQQVSNSYDETLKIELEQKALAYSTMASAFLDALGPGAFEIVQQIIQNSTDDAASTDGAAAAEGEASDSGISNAFQTVELWLPDPASAIGYSLLTRQDLGAAGATASDEVVVGVIEDTAAGGPSAAIDEDARLILTSIPIGLGGETDAIIIATLTADDEFAFFAAQKRAAIRDGLVLSSAIVLLISLVGAALGYLVLRQRQHSEDVLRKSEEKHRLLVNAIPDMMFRIKRDGTVVDFVEAKDDTPALPLGRFLGRRVGEVLPAEFADELMVRIDAALEQRTTQVFDYELAAQNGKLTAYEARIVASADDEVLAIVRNIDERKRAEQELQERVRRDHLTGVLNHGAIVEEIQKIIESENATPMAVAMVDVDDLKIINDSHGHQIGDRVLTTIARELGADGAIVGRYGGDEFVVILPDANRAAAEQYRTGVIESLKSANITNPETGTQVPPAVSIGLAIYPDEAETVADLVRLSDGAMYAAKRERPTAGQDTSSRWQLGNQRAAKLVREITSLLTAPGELNDKLRLVADRVSSSAGYDGVNFMLYASAQREAALTGSTFARASREQAESWIHQYRKQEDEPLRQVLASKQRPLTMNDPQHDELLSDEAREMVRRARIRSMLLVPIIWQDELIGSLTVIAKRPNAFGHEDADLLVAIAGQVPAFVHMAALIDELQSSSARLAQAQDDTVLLLAAAAEAHDHTTGVHLRGVRDITEALALELGYADEEAGALALAAVLHDVGKFRVPDSILADAEKLGAEDWNEMQQHTVWGSSFLTGRPGFVLAATVARSHHERWDGAGYPDRLRSEAIPECAAIVAVADAFDAMTHDRPYRAARPVASAIAEIEAHSGKQFSPKVVEALMNLQRRRELPVQRPESAQDHRAA